MQYLLTEEEYKEFKSKPSKKEFDKIKKEAKAAGDLIKATLVDGNKYCAQEDQMPCDNCPLKDMYSVCTDYREWSQ